MKIAVWDTYVQKVDGNVMHFDILVPDEVKDRAVIYGYGAQYLERKGQKGQSLNAKQCSFCHIEEAPEEIAESVTVNGYHIIEMEGCA